MRLRKNNLGLQQVSRSIDLILIPISSPLRIGIYENLELIEEIESADMVSEFLPTFFSFIFKKYKVNRIVYSNGPGSYMAIKLTYIFLKTLQISKNIEILAVDGFYFNNNLPIKAIQNRYFIKENGKITIKKADIAGEFRLPKKFVENDYSTDIEPVYILDAV